MGWIAVSGTARSGVPFLVSCEEPGVLKLTPLFEDANRAA